MFKNREFKLYLLAMAGITLLGYASWIVFYEYRTAVFLGTIAAVIIVNMIFTWYRYGKIKEMASYMNHIRNGNFKLDIRDHREGELSILKSEVYKMTLKLTEQAELLKKDKIYLSNAIQDISHQLKTPITSMMVMADLLGEEKLPAGKREEFNERLHNQLGRIEWLVSTLLKMSKLDAETIQLKRQKITTKQLMDKALEHLLIPIDIKEIELITDIRETTLFADPDWLPEAFSNVIKNCVEHTPHQGTIRILSEDNAVYTRIVIEDSGEGIAPQDIPHIFERFYKGRNSSPDSVGIGLAFARQIILLQGGTIEAQNREEGGSRMIIKIYKNTG